MKNGRALVTGCAGFVGSTVVDRLLRDGFEVTGIDNFSTGREEFLNDARSSDRFELIRGDLLDGSILRDAVSGVEVVFHMAANADVRFGTEHPRRDFEQNTQVTLGVLEAMRVAGVPKIVFASTGSVYGETPVIPTPEDAPLPIQTSLYGASKIAAEGFIEAYCEGFGIQSFIFRFVSLLGERYTHGHVIDFYRQLKEHPDSLHVLGNGKQRKSYLYVGDCVDAIMLALSTSRDKVNIFNLGTDEYCEVDDSIGWIANALDLAPKITYQGGSKGWIGDNPFIFLDCARMRKLGWLPSMTIRQCVEKTVGYLASASAV
jgi:UDP-glucose 4-epimerase